VVHNPPHPRPSTKAARAAFVAALVLSLAGPAVRAGQLDHGLVKHASGHVLYDLHEKRYCRVGVLPFEVKKGEKDSFSYDAPLSRNVTTRLENALILTQDAEGDLVGIIRDAAGTAGDRVVTSFWTDRKAFDELFSKRYTLAWGNRQGRADAFLTGQIINRGDRPDKVTVVIQIIDRESWDVSEKRVVPRQVVKFSVKRDRSLLSDLGIPYALPRQEVNSGLTREPNLSDLEETTDKFSSSEQTKEKQPSKDKQPAKDKDKKIDKKEEKKPTLSPDDFGGMSFALFYEDDEAETGPIKQPLKLVTPGDGKAPFFEAPSPRPGSNVNMVLKRLAEGEGTLGVVIKLNGLSIWRMEDQDSSQCAKWLYDPTTRGKKQTFSGFMFDGDGKNLQKFKAMSLEKVRGKDIGKRVGWITVDVFADVKRPTNVKKEAKEDEVAKKIGLRSVGSDFAWQSGGAQEKPVTTKSLCEVQEALRKANNLNVKPIRFPLQGDGEKVPFFGDGGLVKGGDVVKGEALKNPQLIGSIAIRYYDAGEQK
jgi:hypothetical protein